MHLIVLVRRMAMLPGRKADLQWWVDTISGIALFSGTAVLCRVARFSFNFADAFPLIGD